MILEHIDSPADLRALGPEELSLLSAEIREFIVDAVTATGGHLGSNLGVVELTLALHRIFDSPRDVILWDTGHQAYVHKLVTGRRDGVHPAPPGRRAVRATPTAPSPSTTGWRTATPRPSSATPTAWPAPSSSRAASAGWWPWSATGPSPAAWPTRPSTTWATRAPRWSSCSTTTAAPTPPRCPGCPSASPTSGSIRPTSRPASASAISSASCPVWATWPTPGVHGLTSALREVVTPHTFFEALGIRYAGPIDGHDIAGVEQALANASEWLGPIVVHVLTQKGRGYAPAEEDDVQRLHDVKVAVAPTDEPLVDETPVAGGRPRVVTAPGDVDPRAAGPAPDDVPAVAAVLPVTTFTDAFTRALLRHAAADPRIVAITAAMPGPTGLLPFQARFPDRFVDVGIAEQHAVTAAAGMAMAGLRPVVAVYSTFVPVPSTRPTSTSDCTGCRSCWCWTGPASPATTGPATTAYWTWPSALSIPGHDRLRPVLGPGGRGHAGRGPDPPRPFHDPLPEDAGAVGGPGHAGPGGLGARGPPGPGRGRLGLRAGGGQDGHSGRGGRPDTGRRGRRRHGVGRPGGVGSRSGHAGRRRSATTWW